jgi:hypothetical protein
MAGTADQDIIGKAISQGRSSVSNEEAVGLGNDIIKPKPAKPKAPDKPVPLPEPNVPGKKPMPAKSWVQELKEHVQNMFRRRDSQMSPIEKKNFPDYKPMERIDSSNLNNTSSRY